MAQADLKLKEEWLRKLRRAPAQIAERLVAHHRKNAHDLKLAIWLNPKQDPWRTSLELLEIFRSAPMGHSPEFRPVEFAPQDGWPRLKITITSPGELNFSLETDPAFVKNLQKGLDEGSARVVFPKTNKRGRLLLDELLGEAEG